GEAMAQAATYDKKGVSRGAIELPDALFGQQVHEHLLYQSVKTFLANQRQGTAKVKDRKEVTGGGKKPWKQKGTGRARSGSNTSPLWPGGGRAFGPTPRDYSIGLPKKQRRAALVAALSLAASEGRVRVVEDPGLTEPKTKEFAGFLARVGIGDEKTLVLVGKEEAVLFKASRNLARVRTSPAHQGAPYYVLEDEQGVITQKAPHLLKEGFGS